MKGKANLIYNCTQYEFTVVYCESVNLIGYITVVCLLTDNSCTRDCTRDCTCDPFSTWRAKFAPDVT